MRADDWDHLASYRSLEENHEIVTQLINEKISRHHGIGFLLGSGVSCSATSVTWTALVKRLITQAGLHETSYDFSSSDRSVRLAEHQRAVKDSKDVLKDSYLQVVQSSIYMDDARYESALSDISPTCELIRRTRLANGPVQIITLNFDDFIDSYLRCHCHASLKISPSSHITSNHCDFHIHHTHGYLPRSGFGSGWIVFSEDEYEERKSEDPDAERYREFVFSSVNNLFQIIIGVGDSEDAWQVPVRLLNKFRARESTTRPHGIWCVIGSPNNEHLDFAQSLGYVPVRFENTDTLSSFLDGCVPM